ncbi:MAG: DUF1524 domain-containing protein [Streptosporangiales bacterium]|nr:DUF1524 domain-containing protein [Streptosporangiales bacterium]
MCLHGFQLRGDLHRAHQAKRDPSSTHLPTNCGTPAWDVQIDHVYPLAQAWDMGAHRWPLPRRVQFANDLDNLRAVDGSANMSKSDSGPGEWMPDNRDYHCRYAADYLTVASGATTGISCRGARVTAAGTHRGDWYPANAPAIRLAQAVNGINEEDSVRTR